ncbi:MAG: folate-binding protein [Pseudomonadota bacterium]
MKGFRDESRVVLRVTGADARVLLQDLVTNDLDRLEADGIVYAALLTPQGKFLFDFFVSLDGEAMLIDVMADRAPALAQRLAMYKLRRDMTIEATDTPVWLIWGEAPDGGLADPRAAALGWRVYGEASPEAADPSDYAALCVAEGVPMTGADLVADDSYILEMDFERLNGVDFRKGCYVGQEVTARMKHKTTLRKGLARVSVEGEAATGDAIEADGKPAGRLGTVSGGEALAHLRFDRAEGEMTAGAAKIRRL